MIVNLEEPVLMTITEVTSATVVKVKGDAEEVADSGDFFLLSPPPGVNPQTGTLAGIEGEDVTWHAWTSSGPSQYLWAQYRYMPPMLGFTDWNDSGNTVGAQSGGNKLGQYHCNNRVYNIHQGRWTSTDPSSSPWTNVLSYTHGNHLKYTDPTGLDDEEIIDEDGDGFDDRFRAIKCKTGFTAEAASGQEPCDCPVKLCQADTFGALGKAAGLKHCYIKLQCSDYLIFELDKSETGEKKSQVHRRKVIEMDAKDDKCVCISGTIWGTPINTDLLYGILMSMALRKEQYDYDVFSRNCCHWAVEILRRIGANLSGINRCGFSDNQGFNKDFTCPEDRPQVNDDDEFPVRPRHN